MKVPLPLFGVLLLPLFSFASPTPTPCPTLSARAAITSSPFTVPSPSRPNDNFAPTISRSALDIRKVSIDKPSRTPFSLSLNLPVQTCTPGFSAYATPGRDGYVPADACNALWLYFPKFGAAIAFSILFGALTIAHLCQAILYRNGFCWVIITAALWETGAYVFRALGSKNQQSSGIATVAQILVLVAPIWVNAFAYMVFARVVHFYSPTGRVWFFPPSVLALVFVTLDIACFVIQLIGGGMAGPGSNLASQKKGLNIYMGGIGMQEGFIVLFAGLVLKFHRDQLQAERQGRLADNKVAGWRSLIWALYGSLLAITTRIVYRLAEFSAGLGASNPLPGNEPLLYVLESTPMWIAIFAWNVVHPGRFIYGEDAKMPQSWLVRHLCCGCCRRRRHKKQHGHLGRAGFTPQDMAVYSELEEDREMNLISTDHRDHSVAAPVNPFMDQQFRESSPDPHAREQPLNRLPPHVANDCTKSRFEPPSYSPYLPSKAQGQK